MDDIDRLIKDTLKQNIDIPLSCENTILYTLKKNNLVKKYKHFKFIKSLCTACLGILFSTGIVFAGYTVYEKVWKEPTVYNSLEEKINHDKNVYETTNKANLEKNEVISSEKAISIAQDIYNNLNILESISQNNLTINKDVFTNYYDIQTQKYNIVISANGIFRDLINNSFNYISINDNISEEEAINIANTIIQSINLDDKYNLQYIERTKSFKNGNGANIWFASYYQMINGLDNKYNCINISFNVVNNILQIESIITIDNDFKYENNEVILTKDEAIKIAKEIDRKISVLDITSCKADLEIERLNSFVYIQEQTLGKEDEQKNEIIDGVIHSYTGYSHEKILRTIWNVKIYYDYNNTNARNDKERFGRNYYIDSTTGEVIGGSWGKR